MSVQVTSAGGWRPIIVLVGEARAFTPFVERPATAGFATVACDPRSPAELKLLLEALERGDLGVEADARYALVACRADGTVVLSKVRSGAPGGRRLDRIPVPNLLFDAMSKWLLRELR